LRETKLINAFTVDVEDYYHVSAFERHVERARWESYESRVVASTRRILTLLEKHDVRGTFFVLGWVADHQPALVREIHTAGHEIGSHGYWHRLIYNQTPDEFRTDLVRSRNVLEDLIGSPVTSYRAPSFSITHRSLWALDILIEEGFQIDSSIFPVYHDRYGIPGARRDLHQINRTGGSLWEFPVSVRALAGLKLPVSGGGYFRLYPLTLSLRWLQAINERQQQPFVFYVHPWEVDPDQPRLPAVSRLSRFRHYVNLGSTHSKLDALVSRFQFAPLRDVVAAARQPTPAPLHSAAVSQP
jgi:polysaccharide deacetylase family protein (PEP-CTERM system associated)